MLSAGSILICFNSFKQTFVLVASFSFKWLRILGNQWKPNSCNHIFVFHLFLIITVDEARMLSLKDIEKADERISRIYI